MADVFERIRENFASGAGGAQPAVGRDRPNVMTRYMGGHNRDNHPYVSGYWQLVLDPPAAIFDSDAADATTWWHCTAEGFTPPTRTLNKADVPGQGGLGSSFVTGQTLTRTFTVTYREYQELPIFNIFQLWCSVIDPYTGVSELDGEMWVPKSYKGSAMAILTKPTISQEATPLQPYDIEEVFYFHGVFPEAPPYDTLGTDIATNDVVQHSITFSFDGWPLTRKDPDVVEQAIAILEGNIYFDDTYMKYLQDVKGIAAVSGAEAA